MLKGFFGCLTQAYERRLNNGASFISHGPWSLSSYSCRVYLLATQAVGKEIGAASSYPSSRKGDWCCQQLWRRGLWTPSRRTRLLCLFSHVIICAQYIITSSLISPWCVSVVKCTADLHGEVLFFFKKNMALRLKFIFDDFHKQHA